MSTHNQRPLNNVVNLTRKAIIITVQYITFIINVNYIKVK